MSRTKRDAFRPPLAPQKINPIDMDSCPCINRVITLSKTRMLIVSR